MNPWRRFRFARPESRCVMSSGHGLPSTTSLSRSPTSNAPRAVQDRRPTGVLEDEYNYRTRNPDSKRRVKEPTRIYGQLCCRGEPAGLQNTQHICGSCMDRSPESLVLEETAAIKQNNCARSESQYQSGMEAAENHLAKTRWFILTFVRIDTIRTARDV
jgi:hypothetical protein